LKLASQSVIGPPVLTQKLIKKVRIIRAVEVALESLCSPEKFFFERFPLLGKEPLGGDL
jgi:hypothetical protein